MHQLESQADAYRELLEFVPVPLCVTTHLGVCAATNRVMALLLDADAGTLVGTPFGNNVRAADRPHFQRALEAACEGEAGETAITLVSSSNRETQIHLRAMRSQQPDRVLWCGRNGAPSEQPLARDRAPTSDGPSNLKPCDVDAEASGPRVAMSAELRAPIETILGWTKLLQDDDVDAEVRKRGVSSVERNARLQFRHIEMLVELSRAMTNQLQMEKTKLDLATVVEDVVDGFRPEAHRRGVELVAEFSRAVLVVADPLRLRQITSHLLATALRSTPAAGRIRVRVDASERIGRLSISDTGRGISPAQLPRFGESFANGAPRPLEDLGVLLALKLVELHDGNFWAESEGLGKGKRVIVALPLAKNGSK